MKVLLDTQEGLVPFPLLFCIPLFEVLYFFSLQLCHKNAILIEHTILHHIGNTLAIGNNTLQVKWVDSTKAY